MSLVRNFSIPILNQVGVIPIYRILVLNFFNFGIILSLIIFDTFVASKVFTLTFKCDMTHRYPSEKVKDVAVSQPGTGNL